MKRLKVIIPFGIIVVLLVSFIFYNSKHKPLKALNASEVSSIEALAQPPNEIKIIDKREDIDVIVSVLKKILIYDKVKQNDYDGQIITYTLSMKDGSQREIIIGNPIIKIDGVFYKTEYGPANKLNELYNKLNYKTVSK